MSEPTLRRRTPADTDSDSTLAPPASRAGVAVPGAAVLGLLPPALHERFDVIGKLGVGGMGVVFRMRDRRLGREVALKLIRVGSTAMVKRFEVEAKTLAGLEHENVVRVYDYGLAGGVPYLVMEYVRGMPLSARLAQGRPTPVESARILVNVLDGLAAAHRRGIVHRDIKPANIFLETDGRAKVADFGLAQQGDGTPEDEELTPLGTLMGTPGYMAPEQYKSEKVGPAADVFAVGVIMHQMLTGQKLFSGTPDAILAAMTGGQTAAPSTLNPSVPPALDALVARALALEPADRPGAEELATSLRHWLDRVSHRKVSPTDGLPAQPYKPLEWLGQADAPIFFGRDAEVAELVELLEAPRVRVVFVFGPCGIGKSSLLRAGLVPALDPAHHAPEVLVAGPDPARAICESVAARALAAKLEVDGLAVTPSALEENPRALLDLMLLLQGKSSRIPVLVIDQLEELFTQNAKDSPHVTSFFQLISTLVESQALQLKVVLAFRAEFRGECFPLEERLGRYQRSFMVREMNASSLAEVIEGPSQIGAYEFHYEKGVPERLAEEVLRTTQSTGQAALPVTQIVCSQLVERVKAQPQRTIDLDLFESASGGMDGLIQRYVEERLASPEYGQQGAIARKMLALLTVKDGRGERFSRVVDEDELLSFPEGERPRQTLERLVKDQLVVREIGDCGNRRVRLASNIICPLVDSWSTQPDDTERAGRILAWAYRQWEEHGSRDEDLLSGGLLRLVQSRLPQILLSDAERRYVDLAVQQTEKRFLRMFMLLASVIVCLMIGVLVAVSGRIERQVLATERSSLEATSLTVREFIKDHYARLLAESTMIAESPRLIAAVDTEDPKTVAEEAQRYQTLVGAGLFVVFDKTGQVMYSACTSGAPVKGVADIGILAKAKPGEHVSGLLVRGQSIFLACAVPLKTEAGLSGYLVAGFAVDRKFADMIKSVAANDVAIALGGTPVESTLPGRVPVPEAASSGVLIWIGDREMLVRVDPLGADGSSEARTVLMRDLGPARAFGSSVRWAVGALGAFGLVLALAISYYLTRRVSRLE